MGRPVGRPPKPVESKRRAGNPGHRALPAGAQPLPPAPPAGLEPPRPLGRSGRDLWDRVWKAGAQWVSSTTDVDLVLVVCELQDERAQLRVRVLQRGEWRDRVALRQVDRQLLDGLSLLGFTPTDRARIGGGEVKPHDELAEFRARVEARRSGA